MEEKKYGRINITVYADSEAREAFDWLRQRDINVSAMVKRILKEKVAEMKVQEENR